MSSSFREPPPQDTAATHQGQDWLYRFAQFVRELIFPIPIVDGGTGQTSAQNAINALTQVSSATVGYVLTKNAATGNADWEPGGGGSGLVNSVSTTDAALTISPTIGAVIVSANNFVGDSGSGGVHGDVPAPSAGDAAASKFLKADGTWGVPAGAGSVTSVGLALPTELTVSGSPVTTAGTLTAVWKSETQHFVFSAPSGSSGTPAFRALVASDIPALSYVTSVALTVPAEFSIAGSPITSSGTFAITKATETANFVWAGPTTGAAAQPTFRALVTADMPSGTGTVTSVALSLPTELTVSGSPVTTSGTLSAVWASETAHFVFAAPVGGGTPSFRAMVAADLPNTAVTPATYGDGTHVGQFTVDAQGRLTAASSVTITGAAPTGSAGGDLTGTYPNPTIIASVSLTTPNINVATATSVNKVAITAPAAGSTLTIVDGKTLTVDNTLEFAGTDSTVMTFPPASASVGYLNIPQNSQSAAYTTVLADSGKHLYHPAGDASARTFTIDSNANVAYAIGTAITFINATAQVVTIAITSDTMTLANTTTTGSRSLAQNGVATAVKTTATTWIISGTGIS